MNFKDLKQWEQLDREIEFWKGIVENEGAVDIMEGYPLCEEYNNEMAMGEVCCGCPLKEYVGANCDQGTPFSEWDRNKTPQTAQAMVDRLVEIRNILHRIDR